MTAGSAGHPGETTRFVGVRFPKSLLAAIDELAASQNTNRSDAIRASILAHLEHEAPHLLNRRARGLRVHSRHAGTDAESG